eukprot:scaffold94925_cov61-Phaeocystis_antarctica.AAC.3
MQPHHHWAAYTGLHWAALGCIGRSLTTMRMSAKTAGSTSSSAAFTRIGMLGNAAADGARCVTLVRLCVAKAAGLAGGGAHVERHTAGFRVQLEGGAVPQPDAVLVVTHASPSSAPRARQASSQGGTSGRHTPRVDMLAAIN